MVKCIFRLSILFMAFILAGCGQSILDSHDARCPFYERGGCQSMEMVNRMVTEKRYTPDGQFVQQAQTAPVMRARPSTYQK